MPNRVTPLDLAQENNGDDSILFALLSSIFPPTLIQILAKLSNFLWNIFTKNQSSNDPSSWVSTLLPPLISLFLLYLSLLAAYRTMRSTLRLFIFTIKWGVILGSLIAIYAVYTGNDQTLDSMGQVPISRGGLLRGVGKALGWAGTGGLMPSILLSALPFLNSNDQTSNSQRSKSSSRSQTRKSTRQKASRKARKNSYSSDDSDIDFDFQDLNLNSNPLVSNLESLVQNLFNSNSNSNSNKNTDFDDEEEEDYYQRTGLRKKSIRRSRNRNENGKGKVGEEINKALKDFTGLNLNLDFEKDLNVGDLVREASDLLENHHDRSRNRNSRSRSGSENGSGRRSGDEEQGQGGLMMNLVKNFLGR